MDGPEFIKSIRKWRSTDVPEMVKTVHQKITLEALARLVSKTPVDTGRARGNWQVAIGSRPSGQVKGLQLLTPHDPPLPNLPPSTFAPAGNQALETGKSVIATIKPFVVSHVTNNVVYIIALEEGHSKQGDHMLEMTFEELVEMFA